MPPTHPTVYSGLALAVVGLLLATYAYTGTRVYSIGFAFVAALGGLLALAGILTAAWGRSIMAARAARSRRGLIKEEALKLDESLPTVAAPAGKKRRFTLPKLGRSQGTPPPGAAPPDADEPLVRLAPEPASTPGPADDAPLVTLTPEIVRVSLRCPACSETFSAEGARPFRATCPQCGFSATV